MTLAFDQQAHAEPVTVAAPRQEPLPSGLAEEFSARFGTDLDGVSIAPTAAAPSVTESGADAVTIGDDIAFGEAAYQPGSGWGRELIAHELAHVVQQRGGTGGPPLTDPAAYDKQADAAAGAALAGQQVPALSAVPVTAQARVRLQDVGRGEQSGFARVPELVERLNQVSLGLIFRLRQDGRFQFLQYTRILPLEVCSEFDRRMVAFIDDATEIPLRFTNRQGLLGSFLDGPHGRHFVRDADPQVFEDAWQSGYVDIDDLLASSALGIQDVLVHFMTERRATPNYVHRMGMTGDQPGGLETREGLDDEFQHAHRQGLLAEVQVIQDFLGLDAEHPLVVLDLQHRVYRTPRRDTVRVKVTPGHTQATSGIQAVDFEVVLHDSHEVLSAEDYRALLDRERAAAAAAGAAVGAGVH
ncbi:MAG: DUF4157 domain-containing protein [Nostocoides sp.]